jgi:hypothetical protein
MTYDITKTFLINELQLIEVYVEFNGPILYSAYNDSGQIFLILLIDQNDSYDDFLYLPISLKKLQKVRQGLIDLYLVFSQPESFILKVRNYFDETDLSCSVEVLNNESLEPCILPSPNTFIDDCSQDLPIDFVREEHKLSQLAIENNRDALEFKLKPLNFPELHEISAFFFGKLLVDFQDLIFSLLGTRLSNRDPSYAILKEMATFNALASFPAGSFVVKLISANQHTKLDIFDGLSSSDIIEDFIYLLNSFSDINLFKSYYSSFSNSKNLMKLSKNFLKSLVSSGCNLDIFWGSPSLNKGGTSSLSLDNANIIIELINSIQDQQEIPIQVVGKFFRIDTKLYRFGFKSINGDNDYVGKVSPSILNIFKKVNSDLLYSVLINRTVFSNALEQDYTDELLTISEYIEPHKQLSLNINNQKDESSV